MIALVFRYEVRDQEAFERIRRAARSDRRALIDVVDELLTADRS